MPNASKPRKSLTSTDIAQPALGAVEVALLRVMRELGLRGDMAAGHSYGEFVALHAADAIDFDTLMRLSASRGQSIVDAARAGSSELGTMAAVRAQREEVARVIAGIGDVIVANHNAPSQVVISGSNLGVGNATEALIKAGFTVTQLPVAAAFHSRHVQPARQAFAAAIDSMEWREPSMPVYANASGRPHAPAVDALKQAMAEHLVHPVEFVSEIEAMYADGARIFVEIGPKAVLTGLTRRILGEKPHVAIALNKGHGLADFVDALGQMLCAGIELDVQKLFEGRDCRIVDPAKLASLKTSPVVSRTAWLLNGSSARRASEPQRQVGVTLEQATAIAHSSPFIAPVATAEIVPAGSALRVAPSLSGAHTEAPTYAADTPMARPSARGMHTGTHLRKSKEFGMNEHRPAATLDSVVMADYFETMRQFLDTQSQVMAAFMGDAGAARIPMPLHRVAPRVMVPHPAEPVQAIPAPILPVQVSVPPPQRANGVAYAPAPTTVVLPPVAAQQPVAAKVEVAEAAPRSNGVAKIATASDAKIDRAKLTDMLLGIVEEKTGYPRDMVGLDQNLEADLGIDSIKRIEVVGTMLQSLPDKQREALTAHRSKLNTQATLNGMLELLTSSLDKAAAA